MNNKLKKDFPFFVHHPSYAYLDNAATTHKPYQVIQTMSDFYGYEYASIYRGLYTTAEAAAQRYESVRADVAQWIGAASKCDIVFTGGATESIAIVADSWARYQIQPGDEIVLSELEHHANILPWQRLAAEKGAVLTWIELRADGTIDPVAALALISSRTRLVAITACSNVLGNIDNLVVGEAYKHKRFLADLINRSHEVGARVLVDASQLVPHQQINMQVLRADFLVFSAHKMLGPQGVGVLYVAPDLHMSMRPYQLGGGVVASVQREVSTFRPFPYCLEAGTQPVAAVLGFGAALNYLREHVDMSEMHKGNAALCKQLVAGLEQIPGVRILGPSSSAQAGHMVSFVIDGMHPHDIAAYLDTHNIAVRAGNQCAQLVHKALGVHGSVRASLYLYNDAQDIDHLLTTLASLVNKN